MEFKPYTETKTQAERIAYVKANPDKYKPLAQYRKEQEESALFSQQSNSLSHTHTHALI